MKRIKYRTTNSPHPYPRLSEPGTGLEIAQPEKVWVCDITYVRLGQGFVFLAIVMDVFTRAIRGWNFEPQFECGLDASGFAACTEFMHSEDPSRLQGAVTS